MKWLILLGMFLALAGCEDDDPVIIRQAVPQWSCGEIQLDSSFFYFEIEPVSSPPAPDTFLVLNCKVKYPYSCPINRLSFVWHNTDDVHIYDSGNVPLTPIGGEYYENTTRWFISGGIFPQYRFYPGDSVKVRVQLAGPNQSGCGDYWDFIFRNCEFWVTYVMPDSVVVP